MYRKRFGLLCHPLPKDARGKTFFEDSDGFRRLQRAFTQLRDDRGLGVLTGDAGVGKTAAMRHLCHRLPGPDHKVLYVCDTAVSPLDLYRTIALELGVKPSHRRAQLWHDIKATLTHLSDEQGTQPIIILDEAQHLSDKFLIDLSGFLNFAFDSRELLTLWLVGMPALCTHLSMRQHAPLALRVAAQAHLEPLGRDEFLALVEHGLRVAGPTQRLFSEPALELLYRHSRGVARVASRLLRASLREAHERDQSFVDEHIVEAALAQVFLVTGAVGAA